MLVTGLNGARGASFNEANQAYADGQYGRAIEQYRELLERKPDAALHYNLANAYYRNGDAARAILHYEKALKLAPRDQDAAHNLKIAQLQVKDKVQAKPEFFLLTWWKQLATVLCCNTWSIGSLAGIWLAVLLFAAFAFTAGRWRGAAFYTGVLALMLGLLFLSLASTRHKLETRADGAIILSPSVSVKSAPLNTGTDLFIIHDGLKVRVLQQENDWMKIELADGKEGWVPAHALETI